jgi:NADH-quinone oxidoreductase subunit A
VASGQPLELTQPAITVFNNLGVTPPDVSTLSKGEAEAAIRTAATQLAWISIADIAVFFFVLLVGFAYLWRRGDIDWVRALQAQRREEFSRRPPTARDVSAREIAAREAGALTAQP